MNSVALTYTRDDSVLPDYGADQFASSIFARPSFGKILSTGVAACALISGYSFNFNNPDINSLVRNISEIESCESAIAANIRDINKVVSFVSDTGLDEARDLLINQILTFKTLVNNWDGYGAIPLGAKCASSAIRISEKLSKSSIDEIDDCFPNTNGSVSLQWSNQYGERLSLSIGANSFSYYCKKNGVDIEMYDELAINDDNIISLDNSIQSIILANV